MGSPNLLHCNREAWPHPGCNSTLVQSSGPVVAGWPVSEEKMDQEAHDQLARSGKAKGAGEISGHSGIHVAGKGIAVEAAAAHEHEGQCRERPPLQHELS